MRVFYGAVAAFVLVMAGSALWALDQESADQQQGDPALRVVVTASRDEQSVLESPAMVRVIGADEIRSSGRASLTELLSSVPGISVRSYSGDAEAQVSMRGFGENSFGRVTVLVDGRRLNNPDMQGINWLSIPLASIDKIEIMDGGAAVLYGSGAVGGVINIITRRSGGAGDSSLTMTMGGFDTLRGQFTLDIGSDDGGVQISLDQYNSDGYRDRSAVRSTNLGVSGFRDIGDRLTLDGSASVSDSFYQMPGALTLDDFRNTPRKAANPRDEGINREWTLAASADWQGPGKIRIRLPLDWSFKSVLADTPSWMTPTWSRRYVNLASARPGVFWTGGSKDLSLRASGGVDLGYATLSSHSYSDPERTVKTNAFEIEKRDAGLWISGTARHGSGLGLTAGARWDTAFIAAENRDASVSDSAQYSLPVWDLRLSWTDRRHIAVHAAWNTVFRYPFTDEVASLYGFGFDSFNTGLRPEHGQTLEGGFRITGFTWLDAGLVAWYVRMEDEIALNASWENENLDRTVRRGGSVDATLRPHRMIELKAAWSLADARFDTGDHKGNRIPLVPRNSLTLGGRLNLPGGLSVIPEWQWVEGMYAGGDVTNTGSLNSWSLMNVGASFTPGYFDGRLSLRADVMNILDESWAPLVYYGGYYPGSGRHGRVSFSWSW